MKRCQDLVAAVVSLLLLILALSCLTARHAAAQESDRIFASGFEGDEGPGADPCFDPLVAPVGWAHKSKTWVDAFSRPGYTATQGKATYPNSVGTPVPVPGYEWFTQFRQGQYQFYTKQHAVSIGFVAEANLTIDMTWDTAQSGPNYGTPRPADSMTIRVSTCPWDFRPHYACARTSGLDSMFLTSRTDGVFEGACPLVPGLDYFINVLMADPGDGLVPGEHTCSLTAANSAEGCDVQMRHSGTYGVLKTLRQLREEREGKH